MKKLLYDDKYGWRVVKDGDFPSINYCVYNVNNLSPSDKLRVGKGRYHKSKAAYCWSFKSALWCISKELSEDKKALPLKALVCPVSQHD